MTVKREFMEEALDSTGAAKVNTESLIISESQIVTIPDIHYNSEILIFRKMLEHSLRWLTSSLREGRRCTGVDF